MRSPEEQRASDDAFHALTVHCWNTCPSDGPHEAICYDLRAEACRAALRERDARWKEALDQLSEECGPLCWTSGNPDEHCDNGAPLRALLEEAGK